MDDRRKTPLHWAAEHDDVETAESLLNAGVDIEARTSWSATPLDCAATMGSTKVADLLLARGAQGMDFLMAASLGKTELVRKQLDSLRECMREAPDRGERALHCLCPVLCSYLR
jgi:ankyrin repeat protein